MSSLRHLLFYQYYELLIGGFFIHRSHKGYELQVVGTLYTHHQKVLIVDTQGPGDRRIVTSFVGGLDLCDGRWDTPTHSPFATLQTTHKNDFHNPSFSVSFPPPSLTTWECFHLLLPSMPFLDST